MQKRVNESEKISKEAQAKALKIAKGTQRPKQTKDQTKLIAQGIEKGISEYRKLEKAKARERDKLRKKEHRAKKTDNEEEASAGAHIEYFRLIPWLLLTLSWAGFATYYLLA